MGHARSRWSAKVVYKALRYARRGYAGAEMSRSTGANKLVYFPVQRVAATRIAERILTHRVCAWKSIA